MPPSSVDSVVTDPPYELGFMGKGWDKSGVAYDADLWRSVYAVLKPGGHLLAFGGTRTYHRLACAIEDAGFEIRDQIGWAYGSGFPKSHNLDGQWQGWGTALKPAWEPIVVARKPLIGTVAENVQRWGTGAINVDGCRVGTGKDKGIWPLTSRRHADVAYTLQPTETDITLGRWPANLIHDGSDEVLALFPETGPSRMAARGGTNPNPMDWGNHRSDGLVVKGHDDNGGSAARFFYCAKASKADREDGLRDGGRANTAPRANHHPTVKPTALMRYLCRLVTPPGGTVLDPFTGSGSTGRGAVLEGFSFIGIEREPEYAAIAEPRIAAVAGLF